MKTKSLKRNDAVAARCSGDAPSQKVDATPSSREPTGAPFGRLAEAGDEASPAPSATEASQLRAPRLRLSNAWFRLKQRQRARPAASAARNAAAHIPALRTPHSALRAGAWYRRCLAGALLLACGAAARADSTNAPAAPPLTPPQMFEGGKDTYNDWVELSAGGLFTQGSTAQAQQQYQRSNGAFGGISDLHLEQAVAKKTMLTLDGHALFDQNDY